MTMFPSSPFKPGLPGFCALLLGVAIGAPALAGCPNPALSGPLLATNASAAYSPIRRDAFAGGSIDLRNCAVLPGYGRINPAPDYTVRYDAQGRNRRLDFRVESACDAVLLVRDPAGLWYFNDDDGGLNPRLRLNAAASGDYQVYVGAFSSGGSGCQGVLITETFDTRAEPGATGTAGGLGPAPTAVPPLPPTPSGSGRNSGACPDWRLGGHEITLLPGGRDEAALVAGGATRLFDNACNLGAYGHVAAAPDFTLRLMADRPSGTLVLRADGDCDTLLLVNDATAQWQFNDDTHGLDPEIRIPSAPLSRYDIWVGTYGPSLCRARFSAEWIAEREVLTK